MPKVVKRINNTFTRADQIQWCEGKDDIDFFAPIVADAEAGFGGVLNAFELMKAMIEAGAAGVHFEDQLASVKKCGHMGGKVLVPTREAVAKLIAARLAADVMGVPTLLLARTDAEAADLVTSDVDDNDKPFLHRRAHRRRLLPHRKPASTRRSARGLAYAPYADLIWCETGKPDLAFAKAFADAIHEQVPGQAARLQLLAVASTGRRTSTTRRSPSSSASSGAMGYKFQFITLAGFHSLNYSMFNLAHGYARNNMSAFVELQEAEFAAAEKGFTAVKHQREVGTGYFDAVTTTIEREASTAALKGSTEDEQFFDRSTAERLRLRAKAGQPAPFGRRAPFRPAAYARRDAAEHTLTPRMADLLDRITGARTRRRSTRMTPREARARLRRALRGARAAACAAGARRGFRHPSAVTARRCAHGCMRRRASGCRCCCTCTAAGS